jgi:hypothetical protein
LETKSKRQLENLSRKSKSAGPHKTKTVVDKKAKKGRSGPQKAKKQKRRPTQKPKL